jgi:amidase
LTDRAYRDALARNHRLSRREGIDAVMDQHRLDALVTPSVEPPWTIDLVNGDHFLGPSSTSPAAMAGYPIVSVPAGYTFGRPVGLSFLGRAFSEPTLIRLAFAFEQATRVRREPRYLPGGGEPPAGLPAAEGAGVPPAATPPAAGATPGAEATPEEERAT